MIELSDVGMEVFSFKILMSGARGISLTERAPMGGSFELVAVEVSGCDFNTQSISGDPNLWHEICRRIARFFRERGDIQTVIVPRVNGCSLTNLLNLHFFGENLMNVVFVSTGREDNEAKVYFSGSDIEHIRGKNVLVVVVGQSPDGIIDAVEAGGGKVIGAAKIYSRP